MTCKRCGVLKWSAEKNKLDCSSIKGHKWHDDYEDSKLMGTIEACERAGKKWIEKYGRR